MAIKQGHRYQYQGGPVLALETELVSGQLVRVASIQEYGTRPSSLGYVALVAPQDLQALPMRYFHNEVPVEVPVDVPLASEANQAPL